MPTLTEQIATATAALQTNVTNLIAALATCLGYRDAAAASAAEAATSAALIDPANFAPADLFGNATTLDVLNERLRRQTGVRFFVTLGDSLTFSEILGSQAAEPYPQVLASITGVPCVNKGVQGYIPRHRVYKLLVDDAPTVRKSDLVKLPASQYEDRVNQPSINNLRSFFSNGKQKWVFEGGPSEDGCVLYQYDSSSTATADGDNVLMPEWVGAGLNNPEYLAGRWIKQAGTFARTTDFDLMEADFIFWLGANGMEADDIVYAADMLLRNMGRGRFYILTLCNRQYATALQADIEDWDEWIGECNDRIRQTYPGAVIDIDGYFMGRGDVGQFGNYVDADANDTSDRALYGVGILPRSVKDSAITTHFNQLGYSHIAAFVARRVCQDLAIPDYYPVPLAGFTRFYQARDFTPRGINKEVIALPNHSTTAIASQLARESLSTPRPTLGVDSFGHAVLKFDGTQALKCLYSVSQPSPRTIAMHVKADALPATRGDIFDGASAAARALIRIYDYAGTKRWSMYVSTDADTGVVADTNWHSIVAVFNNTNSFFYIDNVKYGPFSPGTANFSGPMLGGVTSPGEFSIHEVGDYAGAANDAWVAAYHAATVLRYGG